MLMINVYHVRPTFYQKAKNFVTQLAVFIVSTETSKIQIILPLL